MRSGIGVTAIACALMSALLVAAPAVATDVAEYLPGDKPVVYGKQLILETCTNMGPTSPFKFRLWAKESGQWRIAAPARIRLNRDRCAGKSTPYLHRYVWTVDALGTKVSPLRYDLQLAFGTSVGKATKFVVPEYRSDNALGEHFMCVLTNKNDPPAIDALC